METQIKHRYLYAFLTGCLAKFCFWKYYALFFIPCIMFYALLRLLQNTNIKTSFITGYYFGIGYFLSSISWLYLSFKCYGMTTLGIAATILLALYLAIYPATSCIFYKNRLVFGLVWTICEVIRGIAFSGFPWNLIGYSVMDLPYIPQIAWLITAYGLSFCIMLIAVLKIKWKIILTTTLLLFGIYRENISSPKPFYNYKIFVIQPSIAQTDKLNPKLSYEILKRHLDLSMLHAHSNQPTIIIWPEAVFHLQPEVVNYIANNITNANVHLITGVDINENNKIFNSIIVIGKNGIEARYDKKYLVPFGEFIPNFLLKLGLSNLVSGANYSSGSNTRLLSINNIPLITPIICYESAFPKCIVEQKTAFILNITNDAWFDSKYSDEMMQHLRIARCRAIEEDQIIIRCANNGISCVIDNKASSCTAKK